MPNFVAGHCLLMFTRARCAGPAITSRRFRRKWRLNTVHVEVVLASIASDRLGAVEHRFNGLNF